MSTRIADRSASCNPALARQRGLGLASLAVVAAAILLGACTGRAGPAPAVRSESSIGVRQIARPGHVGVFNGSGRLGTAGFSLRGQYQFDQAWREDIAGVQAGLAAAGGSCLTIPTAEGRPVWVLLLREVFLPAAAELELCAEARSDLEPGSEASPSIYVDFRRINPRRTTEADDLSKRYWIRNGSLSLGQDWKPLRIKLTTPQEDHYGIFISCKGQTATSRLPTIQLRNLRLVPATGSPTWAAAHAEAAIYADRDVPAYQPGEVVRCTVRALLPAAAESGRESLEIDQVDDQTHAVVATQTVELQRGEDGVFAGAYQFPAARFGSYSARVRQQELVMDSFGGDIAVVHPAVEHPRDTPGWGIGVNGRDWGRGVRRPHFPAECLYEIWSGNLRRYYQVLRLAGMKVDRNWNFRWSAIEPEQGRFDFASSDRMLAEHRKHGIEIVGVLGSEFNDHSPDLPAWAKLKSRRHVLSKEHPAPGYIPQPDIWEAYCRAVMEHYKADIRIWECLNEPNDPVSPDEYLELLKIAHAVARSISPEIRILGPCPTGDAKLARVADWSREVLKAGGERYLDGFSYHPYGAGTDYQVGDFFAATTMIRAIRSWLSDPQLPLYNTECFQLANTVYDRCDRWDASTGLRHYLITLGNGVRFCSAFCEYELFKDRLNPHMGLIRPWVHESVPAPVAVALNNLSHQLHGLGSTEVLELNGFVRSYLFAGAPAERALAVVWDLRPGGSRWSAGAPGDGLRFFDLWGNDLPAPDHTPLTLDPVYLSGPAAAVRAFLAASRFVVANPLQITGRSFAGELHLEAKNLSGLKFSPEVGFTPAANLLLPAAVRFVFDGNNHAAVALPGAFSGAEPETLPFTVRLAAETLGDGSVQLLPATASHVLPTSEAPPLTLALSQGSTVALRATAEGLHLTVTVEDADVVAPNAFQPWTGDAVEVFIDCAPFARLDQAQIQTGGERLPVWQYVVPAAPRADEPPVWTTNKSLEKAVAATRRTATGYVVDLDVPWAAIPQGGDRCRIYGLEIEVDHLAKAGGVAGKEALGGKPGSSWRERLHYPLFAVPAAVPLPTGAPAFGVGEVENGGFEQVSGRGRPAAWGSMWQEDAELYPSGPLGYAGSRGVGVRVRTATDKVQGWQQTIPCLPDRATTIVVEALVRAEDVQAVRQESPGVLLGVHFYDDVKKQHMQNRGLGIDGEAVLGTFGWRLLQCTLDIPPGATSMTLHCGLRPGTTGAVFFDEVKVKVLEQGRR